jgi:hypothetical protein
MKDAADASENRTTNGNNNQNETYWDFQPSSGNIP